MTQRITVSEIIGGAIMDGKAFQGKCCLAAKSACVLRDATGQIVLLDGPSMHQETRIQIVWNEFCSVHSAETRIVTAGSGLTVVTLKNQDKTPEEQLVVRPIQKTRDVPVSSKFDLLADFTKVGVCANNTGTKLHIFSPDGFATLMVWGTTELPECGKAFFSNVIKRESKCPQALFELHLDTKDAGRFIIVDTNQRVVSSQLRVDCAPNTIVDDKAALPKDVDSKVPITLMNVRLSNPQKKSYQDKFNAGKTKEYVHYDARVGKNPNTLTLTAWEPNFWFENDQIANKVCNIVCCKAQIFRQKIGFSTCATTAFFWSAVVQEPSSAENSASPSQTPVKVSLKLEEVADTAEAEAPPLKIQRTE